MAIKTIGVIARSKGTDGKFVVEPYIKDIKSLKEGARILIGFSESFSKPYSLKTFSKTKDSYLLSITEVTSMEAVADIKEKGVFVEESDILAEKNKELYSEDDIIGCLVIDRATKKEIGPITEVINLPAHDLWVVLSEEHGEVLLPVIDDIVKRISPKIKRVYVDLIEGLLELNSTKEKV